MSKCEQCGKSIERGKTCGSVCRQKAYRNRSVTQSVTDETVTPQTVTEPVVTFDESVDEGEHGDKGTIEDVRVYDHALTDTEIALMTFQPGRTASLDDYQAHPDDYAQREDAESPYWGAYMDAGQLKKAGLRGNRVSLPGDFDYKGVGVCV